TSVEECVAFETKETPTWIQVVGLHDVNKIGTLLQSYGIHPLVQADVVNTKQMPKVDSFDDYLFVVMRLLAPDSDGHGVIVENFSLLLIDKVLITFQESPTMLFDPVFARLRNEHSRSRQNGCDYLMWALLDAVVDNYFVVLDTIEGEVERFDALVLEQTHSMDPGPIHTLKQQVFHLHRLIRPAREVAAALARGDSGLIRDATLIYLRDLYDHVIHAIEITENLRESAASLRDFYLAAVSNRMNEVMKVLTCFATIFLPLTFLAGIYGMNFQHMPELGVRWAYPALWGVFVVLTVVMLWIFRRKRWL
ncbi:MAG: magnesium/cobalt transporter CorA, partial [Akkermansiaceae bacterium]|nr:magnesium/cobalt transporter CorA [Akkermansiaceae bacterium]